MKKLSFTITLLFISAGLFAQVDWSNKSRLMPDKLRELPVGILMSHDPNPVYPVKEGDTYYWKHTTSVTAVKETLTVIECGSFIWYDASGWHANMKYPPQEFQKAFECPNAILQPGKTYIYKKNWRLGNQPYGGDALWYIIATDKYGKLYKGYALVETESKVLISN